MHFCECLIMCTSVLSCYFQVDPPPGPLLLPRRLQPRADRRAGLGGRRLHHRHVPQGGRARGRGQGHRPRIPGTGLRVSRDRFPQKNYFGNSNIEQRSHELKTQQMLFNVRFHFIGTLFNVRFFLLFKTEFRMRESDFTLNFQILPPTA